MHKIEEYKGQPIIVLSRNENDKYPFQFGIGKAKLILENLDAIKRFAEETKNA